MIVKVQRSIKTTHSEPQVLVYNEDRSFFLEEGMSEEVADLLAGRLKIYCKARRTGKGMIELGEEVKGQRW